MSLTEDLKRIARKRSEDLEKIARASYFEVGNRTIQATPVDTSALKNSWMGATGGIDYSVRDAGNESESSLKVTIDAWHFDDTELYFTNSQPYASRVEYEGHSAQAPEGMLERNLLNWESIVAKNVRRFK